MWNQPLRQVRAVATAFVRTDAERGLLLIKGAVPGSKGGWVTVKDAVKKAAPAGLPLPAAIRSVAPAAAEGGEA